MGDANLEQYLRQMSRDETASNAEATEALAVLKQILEAVRALKPEPAVDKSVWEDDHALISSQSVRNEICVEVDRLNKLVRDQLAELDRGYAEAERLQEVVADQAAELKRWRMREEQVSALVQLAIELRMPNDVLSDTLYDAAVAVRDYEVNV